MTYLLIPIYVIYIYTSMPVDATIAASSVTKLCHYYFSCKDDENKKKLPASVSLWVNNAKGEAVKPHHAPFGAISPVSNVSFPSALKEIVLPNLNVWDAI